MPRVVLFDLYNTLVDGADAERAQICRRQAADLGVDPEVFARLFVESWRERCTGKLGDLTSTLRALAERAGGAPSDAALRLAAARSIDLTRRHLWPSGTTLAALDEIRRIGWRTGLVSNCAGATATIWPTTPLASRFDVVGLSSELGVAKPDPAIFLTVCARLGVEPSDCVYVGDGADDELGAAAALGMSVVRTTEYVASRSQWPPRRIASLGELPALLSGRPG
jgi:putative hydrolase of the HAD superfamily